MSGDWMLDASVWCFGIALVIGVVIEVFSPPQGIQPEDWDMEDEL